MSFNFDKFHKAKVLSQSFTHEERAENYAQLIWRKQTTIQEVMSYEEDLFPSEDVYYRFNLRPISLEQLWKSIRDISKEKFDFEEMYARRLEEVLLEYQEFYNKKYKY